MGGGGGVTKREVGQVKFDPYTKKGEGGVLAILKGGTKRFEVVLAWVLEVLTILEGGGTKGFHPLKENGGGRKRFYPVLKRGAKGFRPLIFQFCSPPSP